MLIRQLLSSLRGRKLLTVHTLWQSLQSARLLVASVHALQETKAAQQNPATTSKRQPVEFQLLKLAAAGRLANHS